MFLQKLSKNLQILYNLKMVTKSQNYSKKYPLTFSVLYGFLGNQIYSASTRKYPKPTAEDRNDISLKGCSNLIKLLLLFSYNSTA